MSTETQQPEHDIDSREQLDLEWWSQREQFRLSAGQLLCRIQYVFTLTFGAPFRWCWWWVTSRELQLVFKALPAIVMGLAVLLLVVESRRAEPSQLAQSYRMAARRAIEGGQSDSAALWLERAVQLQPYDDELLLALAQARLQAGDAAGGYAMMNRIAPNDRSGNPEAHLWIAMYLNSTLTDLNAEHSARLRHHLEAATKSQTDPGLAHALLGTLHAKLSDRQAATSHFVQAVSYDRKWSLKLAEMQRALGDKQAAEATLTAARDEFRTRALQDPRNINARLDWAAIEQVQGNLEVAYEVLTDGRRISDDPRFPERLAGLHVALYDAELQRENTVTATALDSLNAALRLNPGDPQVINRIIDLTLKDPIALPHLEAELNAALQNQQSLNVVHFALGLIASHRNQSEQALLHFKLASRDGPATAAALNNQAWLLLSETVPQYELAMNLVESALVLEPDHPDFLDTRGHVHYHLQNYECALADLERAAAHRPLDPDTQDLVERIYQALGSKR